MLLSDLVLQAWQGILEIFRYGNIFPVKEVIEKNDKIQESVEGVSGQGKQELLQRLPLLPGKFIVVKDRIEQSFVGLLVEEWPRDEEGTCTAGHLQG